MIASGFNYLGVGPQHCYLKDIGRTEYFSATSEECLDAFLTLSRVEGIIPALESAHAVSHAMKIAKEMAPEQTILINILGAVTRTLILLSTIFPYSRRVLSCTRTFTGYSS